MSNELTPMMKQYMQTKEEYKDIVNNILFEFRVNGLEKK